MNILKKALKHVFPPRVLKSAFLLYNTSKANTWDLIFFRKESISKEDFTENQKKNPFLSAGVQDQLFEREIQTKLSLWIDPDWTQDQYLLIYKKKGLIEPQTGWAISADKKLIYPSLGFSNATHVHKPKFSAMYLRKKKIKFIAKVISLRDTGEQNYFHFYNDVLAKLFYLRDCGITLNEFVVVVSSHLYQKAYFQYFLTNPFLKHLNWHIQTDDWIQFDEAIFCKPYTHTKKYFEESIKLVDPVYGNMANRRIFLTRAPNTLRFIENFAEIQPLLERFNFEIVDTSEMSIQNQILLFRECRYLIAIHGAGITNIIFREGQPLSLLEIVHPNPYIPFHYIMLSKLFDYSYDVMLGKKGKLSGKGGFVLDPVKLEGKIISMLGARIQ